jgi:hypothetical protein
LFFSYHPPYFHRFTLFIQFITAVTTVIAVTGLPLISLLLGLQFPVMWIEFYLAKAVEVVIALLPPCFGVRVIQIE